MDDDVRVRLEKLLMQGRFPESVRGVVMGYLEQAHRDIDDNMRNAAAQLVHDLQQLEARSLPDAQRGSAILDKYKQAVLRAFTIGLATGINIEQQESAQRQSRSPEKK